MPEQRIENKNLQRQIDTPLEKQKNLIEDNRLQKEPELILKLNQTLSKQADNLTKALKSDGRSQGNWGELLLQKVLESAGLQEGVRYKNQVNVTDQQGKKLRPDVIGNSLEIRIIKQQ